MWVTCSSVIGLYFVSSVQEDRTREGFAHVERAVRSRTLSQRVSSTSNTEDLREEVALSKAATAEAWARAADAEKAHAQIALEARSLAAKLERLLAGSRAAEESRLAAEARAAAAELKALRIFEAQVSGAGCE